MNPTIMESSFEAEKNRKAATYTAIVCGIILMIAILKTWPLQLAPVIKVQDLIEINLGNEKEGMGVVQPLVKGNPAPEKQNLASVEKSVTKAEAPAKDLSTDEKDPEAAPVTKPIKQTIEAKLPKYEGNPKVVIAEPDITSFKIRNNIDFIIMGCDGIFDKLNNKETVHLVW